MTGDGYDRLGLLLLAALGAGSLLGARLGGRGSTLASGTDSASAEVDGIGSGTATAGTELPNAGRIRVCPDGGADPSTLESDSELVHFVTQDTRYDLILDMLAHPKQSPSLPELAYANPGKSQPTISEHLAKLVAWGIVDKLKIPVGERSRDLPDTFYRVSDLGYKFLQQHELLPADDRFLQAQYGQVEKTEKIQRYEEAPRHGAVKIEDEVDSEKLEMLSDLVSVRSSAAVTRTGATDVARDSTSFVGRLWRFLRGEWRHADVWEKDSGTRVNSSYSGKHSTPVEDSEEDKNREKMRSV